MLERTVPGTTRRLARRTELVCLAILVHDIDAMEKAVFEATLDSDVLILLDDLPALAVSSRFNKRAFTGS